MKMKINKYYVLERIAATANLEKVSVLEPNWNGH